ncbi:SDR family oxidoreductase [Paraburkholderia sp. J67]|uniref:SDR family NAD(P)-dependent oxidoreductase n=1 Tax=Paraburkholderia sp. J67 TaxID=2805435 RepID=UPI002ABE5E46|nr:SDR family oxidoreductase [Paraburkholderia sp. J67]
MAGKLDGQVCVIIGGGRNLGKQIAHTFAEQGAKVVVVGRSLAPLEAVVASVEAAGGHASAIAADVTRVDENARLVSEVDARYGRLDILVNSAGIFVNPVFAETTETEWNDIMDINLKAVFFAVQKAAPVMARTGGNVINFSSVMGVKARVGSAVYAAAKAGVINMTRALALELGPQKIRVNAIAPGFTLEPDQAHEIPPGVVAEMTAGLPAGRPGTAAEIAAAALYLASPEASFTTGTTIFVDGGETAR